MNNPGTNQQAQTVANALSGERSFTRVEFAITGDNVADAISGIRAVLRENKLGSQSICHARHAAFLFEYLMKAYAAEATEKEAELARQRQPLFPGAIGTIPAAAGSVSTPPPPWAYSGTDMGTPEKSTEEMLRSIADGRPKQLHPDTIPGWLPND